MTRARRDLLVDHHAHHHLLADGFAVFGARLLLLGKQLLETGLVALEPVVDDALDLLVHVEHLLGVGQQEHPVLGEHEVSGATLEQRDAQFFLQLRDAHADGGLGQVQPLGRLAEAAEAGDPEEGADLLEGHVDPLSRSVPAWHDRDGGARWEGRGLREDGAPDAAEGRGGFGRKRAQSWPRSRDNVPGWDAERRRSCRSAPGSRGSDRTARRFDPCPGALAGPCRCVSPARSAP